MHITSPRQYYIVVPTYVETFLFIAQYPFNQIKMVCLAMTGLKGTVSQKFLYSGFHHSAPSIPIRDVLWRFGYFSLFIDLLDFLIDSPVLGTPECQPRILGLGTFFKHNIKWAFYIVNITMRQSFE